MKNLEQIQYQIWQELSQAQCALTKEKLCERIGCTEYELNEARKPLVRSGELYHCQEGYVLKEYATYDQQLWHLAWSLGLFEVSAIHLEMDRNLLLTAPKAVKRLLADGRMKPDQRIRLNRLRQQLIVAMDMPKKLLQVYHEVQRVLDDEEEELRLLEEGPRKFTNLKDLKRLKKDIKKRS